MKRKHRLSRRVKSVLIKRGKRWLKELRRLRGRLKS